MSENINETGGIYSLGVQKLLDTIRSMCWTIYEPTHLRRIAKAKAEGEKIKEKSKQEIRKIRTREQIALSSEEKILAMQAAERVFKAELRHQKNLSKIFEKAQEQIPNEGVSPDPVKEDWLADWEEKAKNFSDEEMQSIWAKILAGEVTQPGSFSPQTLAIVKTLSKSDAHLYTQFCSFVWKFCNDFFALTFDSFSLPLEHLTTLEALGLISIGFPGFSIKHTEFLFFYFNQAFFCKTEKEKDFNIGKVLLTRAGKELVQIAGATPDQQYMDQAIELLKKEGLPLQKVVAVPMGNGQWNIALKEENGIIVNWY